MDNKPLISIIVPCYNGEDHVHRLLDSILLQTYFHFELIFVNDGSTDSTEQIVLSFENKFRGKGIKLVYISQPNQGLGGAINAGLKKVTGKYICWPDADDYLEPQSVEKRMLILENFPQYAVVTSDAYIRSDSDLKVVKGLISESFKKSNNDPDQFIHLLNAKSIFVPGTHMVRTDAFFETHPSGQIYPARKGQNYQMLLPVYYKYKRYFLNEPLYNYIRYDNSMSKNENTGFINKINTYNNQKKTIYETISAMLMPDNEKIYYKNIVDVRYSNLIFRTAYDYGNYDLLKKEYAKLKTLNQVSFKLKLRLFILKVKRLTNYFKTLKDK